MAIYDNSYLDLSKWTVHIVTLVYHSKALHGIAHIGSLYTAEMENPKIWNKTGNVLQNNYAVLRADSTMI